MTKKHYLPGRIMNTLWRKTVQFYDKESIKVDKLGKWIGFKLTNQLKTILVITVYRILNCTGGVYSTLSQYNQADGKIKNAAKYRKELLSKIEEYIASQQQINDILIAGNFNQFIGSNEI